MKEKYVVSLNIQRIELEPKYECMRPHTHSPTCPTSTGHERTKDTIVGLTITADTLPAAVGKSIKHLFAEVEDDVVKAIKAINTATANMGSV